MRVILGGAALLRPLTGIGNYNYHLAAGLQKHPAVKSILFFRRFDFSESRPKQGYQPVWDAITYHLKSIPLSYQVYHAVRGACFQAQAPVAERSIYHEPNFILMPYDGPSVTTVHDLSHLRYPQYHPYARVRHMEKELPRSLNQASHIVTVSEFTRREVIETFGISPDKITATPNGVDPAFHPRTPAECEATLKRHGLHGQKYLLSVATLEPRKNLSGLIEAYCRLPEKIKEQYPLVLVGPKGWLMGAIEKRARPLADKGQLRQLGYVPHEDLPAIYAAASGFAFVSHYEGFGLPALEAMASGVPVLASDCSALPEVVGNVGLQVSPNDIPAITSELQRLIEDAELRAAARTEGPKRAADFTWENTVEKTIGVYRGVLGLPASEPELARI